MTIASEANRSGPYACNGATTRFPYAFKIYDEAHIRVILTDETGADATLALGTDYVVSGVGDDGGGAVETALAHPAGRQVTLVLNVPFTQGTDLENQGAYFAETIERSFDLLTQQALQLKELIARSVVLPVTSTVSTTELVSATLTLAEIQSQMMALVGIAPDIQTVAGIAPEVVAAQGNAEAATEAAGTATGAAGMASGAAEAAGQAADRAEAAASTVEGVVSYAVEQDLTLEEKARAQANLGLEGLQNALTPFGFTATAGQTAFDLGMTVSPNACIVSQNGAWLTGGVDYVIAGETLTLSTAAEAGDRISGVTIGSFEVANAMLPAGNLADLGDKAVARANLGLGAAAAKNTGTAEGDVVQVQAGGALPVLDGGNLTGLREIGVGQTWQNMLSSRALGTVYVNDTPLPIEVAIGITTANGSTGYNDLKVGVTGTPDIIIGHIGSSDTGTSSHFVSGIIPPGHYYSFTGSRPPLYWVELRS